MPSFYPKHTLFFFILGSLRLKYETSKANAKEDFSLNSNESGEDPRMKPNKLALLALVVTGWAGFASAVFAQNDTPDFIKDRTYIGAFGTYTGIDSNNHVNGFNGNEYITSTTSPFEIDLLPSLDRNFGFGGLLGRREGPYAIEVSYWRSSHTTHWEGATGSASYQSINIDMKRYFLTKLPFQPFAEFGASLPWLVFKDSSVDENGFVGDFATSGLGLNLGAGVEIYVGDDFSFFGTALQRWGGYFDMSGVQQQHTALQIDGFENLALEGSSLNFLFGGTISFK